MSVALKEGVVSEEAVLQLPGLVATRTGLVVFESATDAQLQKAFGQIARMDGSLAWWIGDLGIALQDRKRAQLTKEAAGLRIRANECTEDGQETKRQLLEKAERLENLGVVEYTRELCTAYDIGESWVKNCVMWARFYEPSNRVDGLSPAHHQVAMVAAGGAKGEIGKAQKWLCEAKERELTASELRKEVNMANASSAPPAAPAEESVFEELIAADAWAVQYRARVEELSHGQVVRLYTLMQGLRELAAALEQRIATNATA